MKVVEGVELDLRGMEWFMENPVGMLAMQDYMQEFEQTEGLVVGRKTIGYCAWGQFYMKPTHVWTSMVFWKPKGEQKGGTGKFRGRCPFGSRGTTGKWSHDYKIGQKRHQLVRGKGMKSNKGVPPLGLHREICRVMQARYKTKRQTKK